MFWSRGVVLKKKGELLVEWARVGTKLQCFGSVPGVSVVESRQWRGGRVHLQKG